MVAATSHSLLHRTKPGTCCHSDGRNAPMQTAKSHKFEAPHHQQQRLQGHISFWYDIIKRAELRLPIVVAWFMLQWLCGHQFLLLFESYVWTLVRTQDGSCEPKHWVSKNAKLTNLLVQRNLPRDRRQEISPHLFLPNEQHAHVETSSVLASEHKTPNCRRVKYLKNKNEIWNAMKYEMQLKKCENTWAWSRKQWNRVFQNVCVWKWCLNCFQQLPHLPFTKKLDSKLNPAFE